MATQSYIDLLQQQFIELQNIQDEENEARNAYRALVQKEPNIGFFEKERSFADALKDPTKAQRSFFTGFGLALAASDSTNSLSSRIAGALGVGAKGMQETREKQLTREQALARLDLEDYKTRRSNITERANIAQKQFSAGLQQDAATIQRNQENRAAERFKREEKLDFLKPEDLAYNESIDNARSAIDLFGSQMIEYTDSEGNLAEISVLDPKVVSIYKQARVETKDKKIPEGEGVDPNLSAIQTMFTKRLGRPTKPNELYNPQFLDQLNISMKVKRSGSGAKDQDAGYYSKLGSGAFGKNTTKSIQDRYKKTKNFKDGVKAAKQKWQEENPGKPLLPETYYEQIVLGAAFRQ